MTNLDNRISALESVTSAGNMTPFDFHKEVKGMIASECRKARIDECEQLMDLKWSVDERVSALKEEE